jgi:type I restriction enzyme S subunit
MKKKSKRTLTPKLRFPEFRDAPGWEEVSLEQIAKRTTTKNHDGSITRVLTNSAEHGIVDQRDYFQKDIANAGNIDGYYIVDLGDYVYNPRISTLAPVGPISRNNIGKGVMSPLYTVFRFEDENSDFYQHYFKTVSWHLYLRRVSSMGARHDRMSITARDFMAMPVPTPLPQEQQKIAECLSSLDGLIAAEGRKLAALRDHKRGLMQQLFPQPGQTQPRLRFPEFRDKGEWEEKKAGSLFSQRKEKGQTGLPIYSVTINDGMVLRSTFDRNFYDIEDPTGNKKAHKNDIAYNMMRMWQGACGVAPEDCMVSPAYVVLKPKKGTCPAFFDVLLKRPAILHLLMAYSRGLTLDRLRLYFGDFASIPLLVPAEPEQQRIADCLSALDTRIAAQAAKIDALKQHKRGLMQQLFPAAEEV